MSALEHVRAAFHLNLLSKVVNFTPSQLKPRIVFCMSTGVNSFGIFRAMVSALVLLTAVVMALSGPDPVGAITSSLQSILKNTHGSKEYEYPTDITRDIYPVSEPWIFISQLGDTALREPWLTSCLDSCALS